jgi:hypothetical protein
MSGAGRYDERWRTVAATRSFAASLKVTGATLDRAAVDGVAAYLCEQLRPVWGELAPAVQPTPVNLPLAG